MVPVSLLGEARELYKIDVLLDLRMVESLGVLLWQEHWMKREEEGLPSSKSTPKGPL